MFVSKRWSYSGIVIISLILGAGLPNIFNAMNISATNKVIWLFFVINFIGAFVLGWFMKLIFAPRWMVLIFPIIFALNTFLLRTNNHEYAYYLASTYLLVSVIARFNTWVVADKKEFVNTIDGDFKIDKE